MKTQYSLIKRTSLITLLITALFTTYSCANDDDNNSHPNISSKNIEIIPQPVSLEYGSQRIEMPSVVSISKDIPSTMQKLLEKSITDYKVASSINIEKNESAFISTKIDNSLSEEEYELDITQKSILITHSTQQGLLWGIQTLRQVLMQAESSTKGDFSIPTLSIKDTPKYAWRGFHIDLARHMFSLDYLKKVTDCLSLYKINKIQLHLTDDQGWRIEIKKHPNLTTVGGWRHFDEYDEECIKLSHTDASYTIDERYIRNGKEYGGFYTQDEIKDFVTFATSVGIEVIPEIDMPGHFSAAIKAYPELSCTGSSGWGEEFSYPVCAGKAKNHPFLYDILDEVMTLFPSKHFHIGADEVEKNNWKKCEDCQRLIAEENLMNVEGLENFFVNNINSYLNKREKSTMAWDDAFYKKEPQEMIYTYWRDWLPNQAGTITQAGFPVVFMEWGNFYLSATPSDEQLQSLYNFKFEPKFKGIVKSNILGFQACIWTEMIPNEQKLGHHLFPSIQAYTEVAWGTASNWDSFKKKMNWHLKHLTKEGFYVRTPDFIKK